MILLNCNPDRAEPQPRPCLSDHPDIFWNTGSVYIITLQPEVKGMSCMCDESETGIYAESEVYIEPF